MIRFIPQHSLIEGRWRNGQGVSWEIASFKKQDASDFSWRFAKARIDNDVPFSIYPGMDRIFMMIEGQGMDLEFEGGTVLEVHDKFVPHEFSCDLPLFCKLQGGPSLDLNLFAAREEFILGCEVMELNGEKQITLDSNVTVLYVLSGTAKLNNETLTCGDSVIAEGAETVKLSGKGALLYWIKLIAH